MHRTATVARLLGRRSADRASRFDLPAAVRRGLPYRAYATLVEQLGLDKPLQSRLFGVSAKTLQRLSENPAQGKPLDAVFSDRVARVAQVYADALETFDGDATRARTWLATPNPSLDGVTPLSLLDTHAGVMQVTEALYRVRYGVFA